MKGAASRHLARQAAQAAVVAGSSRQSTGQGQSMGDRQFMRQMATVLSIDAVGYSRAFSGINVDPINHDLNRLTLARIQGGSLFERQGMAVNSNPLKSG